MALITRQNIPLRQSRQSKLIEGLSGQVASEIDSLKGDDLARAAVGGDKDALAELTATDTKRASALESLRVFQERSAEEGETASFKSMVEGAAFALASGDPVKSLTQRKDRLQKLGFDTSETQEALDVFNTEGEKAGVDLLSGVVQTGKSIGILKPLDGRKLDIEQQKIDIRKAENKERALDRALGREKNQLEREKLQIQLDETRRGIDNKKRERSLQVENAVASTQTAINTADDLITDPGLEVATGLESVLPTIPGTDQADFRNRLETLKSQVFLSQVEKMRGLGALTETEGKALAGSIGSLSINQSDDSLRKAITGIRNNLEEARNRLEKSEGLQETEAQNSGKTIQMDGFTVEFE